MKIKTAKKVPVKSTVATTTARKPAAGKRCSKAAGTSPVTFTLHAEKGKAVYLAGEFNQWNPTDRKMTYKAKEGLYAVTVRLAAGTYQYKFVVDGTWCADPENANCVPNDQGTFNSVVTVR